MFSGQPHLPQHFNDLTANLRLVRYTTQGQTFTNDFLNGHARVQGLNGILKDHGNVAGQEFPLFTGHGAGDFLPIKEHLPAGRVIKANDGTAGGRFAAAAFAYKAKGLGGMNAEGNVIHRIHGHALFSAPRGEGLAKMLDL